MSIAPLADGPRPNLWTRLLAWGAFLFLGLIPFHLVIKKLIPGSVGTYWKEGLLGLLVIGWLMDWLRRPERRPKLIHPSLDSALLIYLALLTFRLALAEFGWTAAWGWYVSVLYLPFVWLIPAVLRQDGRWAGRLLALLTGVGAVVALGGLLEFVLDMSLWPSAELVQRQGFPGMYIYGTQIRRVYFTFDSPTTLANTLALLLPMCLALVLLAKRRWQRLAAALAAALVAACMVVTFSRGIWVASGLSLIAMAALGHWRPEQQRGPQRRRWTGVVLVGGTLFLLGLAWAGVVLLSQQRGESSTKGVVELSPEAFAAAPVTQIHRDLLAETPARGQTVTQTWTLLDPISGQMDVRHVLYQHPPLPEQRETSGQSGLLYTIAVPEDGALCFGIALSPETWTPEKGDGVSFKVLVADPLAPQEEQTAFVRYINPKYNPSDRRWRFFLVDLGKWAGHAVQLSLITEAGPAGDYAYDWAGWAEPQLVSVTPGYFAGAQDRNTILRHVQSIGDWRGDETNRDRLAAWSLALQRWRTAPLWGLGLGSTGVAALRTQPEQAFVTESQVLKSLVELGPLGLLAWLLVWFQIGRVGWRALHQSRDPSQRTVLVGILSSLLVVFVEGWVYQNLEVKQVNAYFWTLVGMLGFVYSSSGTGGATALPGHGGWPQLPATRRGDGERGPT